VAETIRHFRPGEPWAFFKLYCGETTAERLLRTDLGPLADGLEADGVATHWFFVRYGDPAPHIRIRFCLRDPARWQTLLERVNERFGEAVRDGLVWKVQVDTYDRELERYGAGTIELSERMFHRDSQMVLGVLRAVHEAEDEDLRWQFALLAIDRMLADFQYGASARFDFVDRVGKALLSELPGGKALRADIERKYRERKQVIERLADRANDAQDRLGAMSPLIETRSTATAADRQELLDRRPDLEVPLAPLLTSHLHMFCNRLFPSRPRHHELVLYWFLAKYLRGQSARYAGS
jgi:class I lanthipeptide synthase